MSWPYPIPNKAWAIKQLICTENALLSGKAFSVQEQFIEKLY